MATRFKTGDILKYSKYSNHIRRLRDYSLSGGKPSEVSRAQAHLKQEQAKRFLVTGIGSNKFCSTFIEYKIIGEDTTGTCMPGEMELE